MRTLTRLLAALLTALLIVAAAPVVAQGLRVTPAPTDFLVSDAEWQHLWRGGPSATLINLLPNVEYLTYTTRCLKEYIGIAVYAWRGWL